MGKFKKSEVDANMRIALDQAIGDIKKANILLLEPKDKKLDTHKQKMVNMLKEGALKKIRGFSDDKINKKFEFDPNSSKKVVGMVGDLKVKSSICNLVNMVRKISAIKVENKEFEDMKECAIEALIEPSITGMYKIVDEAKRSTVEKRKIMEEITERILDSLFLENTDQPTTKLLRDGDSMLNVFKESERFKEIYEHKSHLKGIDQELVNKFINTFSTLHKMNQWADEDKGTNGEKEARIELKKMQGNRKETSVEDIFVQKNKDGDKEEVKILGLKGYSKLTKDVLFKKVKTTYKKQKLTLKFEQI